MTHTSREVQFAKKLKTTQAWLHFEDGTSFKGWCNFTSDQLQSGVWGEAAFTTAMTGYEETITDPSYLGQHIIFSSAHVGNYESNQLVRQSAGVYATAIIGRQFSANDFLEAITVPILSDVDNRALVKYLTDHPEHKSVITASSKAPSASEFKNAKLICDELERVSVKEAKTIIAGDNPIVLIDYGCKKAIVDNLIKLGHPLKVVPYNTSSETILSLSPRLVFLSNGPGDPEKHRDQIKVVSEVLNSKVPVRGICLGHQLIGLALKAKTIKLPFGQRGINHPCLDHQSGKILITSQNHGYAIEDESFDQVIKERGLDKDWAITFSSLFDQSIEGIASTDHTVKSVQFHPEANPGPSDALIFFEEIASFLDGQLFKEIDKSSLCPRVKLSKTPKKEIPYKKILLIGSGQIKIGQASEFDYSGTQACKSLREIGIDVVLLNSNPATIMTDPDMAFATYIEPITKETIKKIIKKENVDAVLSTMGGQTALNICIELEEEEYLSKNNVALLGANVDTIKKTEDRNLFAAELETMGYQGGKRFSAKNPNDAELMAQSRVGYPLIIRRDFALGGSGAALVYNAKELQEVLKTDVKFPVTMEKSLVGFKEVELEVMVDSAGNGVIICSIENIDPCGVHTGDSITVAPAMTISDRCMQKMRTMSLNIAKKMGVVAGGANVQFAINPRDEDDIVVIEMNPRVSRSSALASKATGYPIAKISALLAVGYTLKEILNDITKASPVAFEPTQDYVALKIPIFPFDKFPSATKLLGPQMRSVGEVLAIGGSFNEAFLKALRSLELGLEIPHLNRLKTTPLITNADYLKHRLKKPQELSLLTALEAQRRNISVDDVFQNSRISHWFLEQNELIIKAEKEIADSPGVPEGEALLECKKIGFSDKFIAILSRATQAEVLRKRLSNQIKPTFKAVDTCSGEFHALTPYYYSTFGRACESEPFKNDKRYIIMGSGPNRIGQGIEFDYSCVKACQQLQSKKHRAIMVNSNPETVSTDYDSSDRLYLAPLYSEDLFDIFSHENPDGIVACFSGQTGIKVRAHMENGFRGELRQFPFMGSTLPTIDLTEDRKLFSEICRDTALTMTKSKEVIGFKNMVNAMVEIGLPVIIRPSYVIGGESMYIFHTLDDIEYLPEPLRDGLKNSSTTFQIETYIENALEYDVDLVRDQKGNIIFTVCEHIEHAGVHSGDSGMISPPVKLSTAMQKKMKDISIQLSEKLNIIGPVNFQFAVSGDDIYCIEANPRGSRTLPFLSKAFHLSLPQVATDAMLGEEISKYEVSDSKFYSVKQSTFPFDRFLKDDMVLGPKMRSTGETMGVDRELEPALLKSYLGNYPWLQRPGKILISLADPNKHVVLPFLESLSKLGYSFCATAGTKRIISEKGIECEEVQKLGETGYTILDALKNDGIVLVLNTPTNRGDSKLDGENIRNTAISHGAPCFTRSENIEMVLKAIIGVNSKSTGLVPMSLQELHQ
ncbi:MAG: carbamoyl phosphate synthase large subunit [Halobacteriovorax sp.]|nr:carbamoyl phosphate synthase large subunit [Halobacteriovorax sp.]